MSSKVYPSIPRPLRNHNPLNIRHSPSPWKGKSPQQNDEEFVQFVDPFYGIRAAALNLLTYFNRHKLSTVPEIINRWAPPEDDNNTDSYVASVLNDLGVAAETRLDLGDPEVMARLVTAMMKIECGIVPYPAEQIHAAVHAAYTGETAPSAPAAEHIPTPPPPRAMPPRPRPPPVYPHPYPPTYAAVERPVPPLVDQPSGTPTRKVQAIPVGGGAGAALAWTVTGLWNRLNPEMPMPMEVAMGLIAGLSILGGWLAAYFTRNRATLPPPDHYWDPKSSPDPYPARYRPRRRPQPRPYHDDDRYDEDPYEY